MSSLHCYSASLFPLLFIYISGPPSIRFSIHYYCISLFFSLFLISCLSSRVCVVLFHHLHFFVGLRSLPRPLRFSSRFSLTCQFSTFVFSVIPSHSTVPPRISPMFSSISFLLSMFSPFLSIRIISYHLRLLPFTFSLSFISLTFRLPVKCQGANINTSHFTDSSPFHHHSIPSFPIRHYPLVLSFIFCISG